MGFNSAFKGLKMMDGEVEMVVTKWLTVRDRDRCQNGIENLVLQGFKNRH